MFLMRVILPDRPGSLGAVATALGSIGADIESVQIVQRGGEWVVDDFVVEPSAGVLPDELISACHGLDEVEVLWISRTPTGSLVTDVEVLEEMLADPRRAGEVLLRAAPRLLHASWAMVLTTDGDPVLVGPNAPEPAETVLAAVGVHREPARVELAADWMPGWPETTVAVVPVPQDPEHLVLVGRPGGPVFFDSELARLRYLAGSIHLGVQRLSTARTRGTSTR
ncbi:amino acid-binding protein [Enemella sp. A6]|uniref:amino acid-binding protein n=1 Tax=Enemella sp. A6 TaxID=3440152 RepID=UPI003EBB75D2